MNVVCAAGLATPMIVALLSDKPKAMSAKGARNGYISHEEGSDTEDSDAAVANASIIKSRESGQCDQRKIWISYKAVTSYMKVFPAVMNDFRPMPYIEVDTPGACVDRRYRGAICKIW